MTKIASPEIEPTITKTDARELKALVRRDTELLANALRERRDDIVGAINEERERRAKEAQAAAKAELRALQRRITKLNEAIVAKFKELDDAGWTIATRGYGATESRPIDPYAHKVKLSFDSLRPPSLEESDLAAAHKEVEVAYREAQTGLQARESEMLRDLTLQSVTHTAARDFIMEMPTAESLLPSPSALSLTSGT